MASVTDFLNQFDEEGRYSALDGVLDVVFATRGDGRYPGKLHFSTSATGFVSERRWREAATGRTQISRR